MRWCWIELPVPWRPTTLDNSRAWAYCACSGCGWGLFRCFFSRLSFLFLPLFGKYCLKGPFKPQTTNPLFALAHTILETLAQIADLIQIISHIWIHDVFHVAGGLLQETGEAGSQTCDPLIGSLACYPLHYGCSTLRHSEMKNLLMTYKTQKH